MSETKRLGRGLESLLGPITKVEAETSGALKDLAVSSIHPNPFQPRRTFDPAALQELADSIEASGLLQPVIVRQHGSVYELISGERRWRAVQKLGWARVQAVVRAADDRALLTLALIENLQRDDLSPIDEAIGYRRLMEEFQVPQTEVARLMGRNRSTVSNTLRLLQLPESVQQMVSAGALSEGHARTLLAVTNPKEQERIARAVAEQGYSVRDTEAMVRGEGPAARTIKPRRVRTPKPHRATGEARRIEEALRAHLGTDVRVTARRLGRGTLAISYYSNDDLTRLLELILGAPFDG